MVNTKKILTYAILAGGAYIAYNLATTGRTGIFQVDSFASQHSGGAKYFSAPYNIPLPSQFHRR